MKDRVEMFEVYDENDPDCPFVVLNHPEILQIYARKAQLEHLLSLFRIPAELFKPQPAQPTRNDSATPQTPEPPTSAS